METGESTMTPRRVFIQKVRILISSILLFQAIAFVGGVVADSSSSPSDSDVNAWLKSKMTGVNREANTKEIFRYRGLPFDLIEYHRFDIDGAIYEYSANNYEISIMLAGLPNAGFKMLKILKWRAAIDGQLSDQYAGQDVEITFSQLNSVTDALKKCKKWIETSEKEHLADGIEKTVYEDEYIAVVFVTPNQVFCKTKKIPKANEDHEHDFNITKDELAHVIEMLMNAPRIALAFETKAAEMKRADDVSEAEEKRKNQEAERKREEEKKRADALLQ